MDKVRQAEIELALREKGFDPNGLSFRISPEMRRLVAATATKIPPDELDEFVQSTPSVPDT